jgi:hypothetical protein
MESRAVDRTRGGQSPIGEEQRGIQPLLESRRDDDIPAPAVTTFRRDAVNVCSRHEGARPKRLIQIMISVARPESSKGVVFKWTVHALPKASGRAPQKSCHGIWTQLRGRRRRFTTGGCRGRVRPTAGERPRGDRCNGRRTAPSASGPGRPRSLCCCRPLKTRCERTGPRKGSRGWTASRWWLAGPPRPAAPGSVARWA